MAPVEIRATLHEYIDTLDEKKLNAAYAVIKDIIGSNFEYSNKELDDIYTRRDNYKNSEAMTLTTKEFIDFVHKAK